MRGKVVGDVGAKALAGGVEALARVAGAAQGIVLVFEAGKELVERGIMGPVDVVC